MTASNYSIVYEEFDGNKKPKSISFKINYRGNILPISINNVIGNQFVYPVLAALSVGAAMEMSLVLLAEGLTNFKAPKGRMNLISGENGVTIIDDTYNSSPIALASAIRNLSEIETEGERIAILGDMAEIGRFSSSEHRKIGSLIKEKKINILITVGRISDLINEQAIEEGMAKGRNFHFATSEEAISTVRKYLEPNNILLIKGSQSMRMEKITKDILLDKERVADLVVRQEKEWLER